MSQDFHSNSGGGSSNCEHHRHSNNDMTSSSASSATAADLQPSKGGKTEFSDIPVKDVVIVFFMLGLWLYSIMLIVRAWAKVHNLPDSATNIGGSMWRFVMEYLQKKRKALTDEDEQGKLANGGSQGSVVNMDKEEGQDNKEAMVCTKDFTSLEIGEEVEGVNNVRMATRSSPTSSTFHNNGEGGGEGQEMAEHDQNHYQMQQQQQYQQQGQQPQQQQHQQQQQQQQQPQQEEHNSTPLQANNINTSATWSNCIDIGSSNNHRTLPNNSNNNSDCPQMQQPNDISNHQLSREVSSPQAQVMHLDEFHPPPPPSPELFLLINPRMVARLMSSSDLKPQQQSSISANHRYETAM